MKKIYITFLLFISLSIIYPSIQNNAEYKSDKIVVEQVDNTKIKQANAVNNHISLLKNFIMMIISIVLIYLAIAKNFEPTLLLPIGFAGILANVPMSDMIMPPVLKVFEGLIITTSSGGFLGQIYTLGIETGLLPIFVLMGIGAMSDFSPLIANPKVSLLGAAAQFGIFATMIGALILVKYIPELDFTLKDAASIGIIGAADGPTAILMASKFSPDLLAPIAISAYSYMALIPIIQPPVMRLLTTKKERLITMKQLRNVSKLEKILFPIIVILLVAFFIPDAVSIIGALMFGNLVRECTVADRLSKTLQNEFANIVTILLGLAIGSKLSADKFLRFDTLGILLLGLLAFIIGTASGIILAKVMNMFSKDKINPLIGASGISAIPMSARVVNKVGLESDPYNFLLLHALGANLAGSIASGAAAGIIFKLLS